MPQTRAHYNNQVLEELHKQANTRIVHPTLAVMTTIFELSYFTNTFIWYFAVSLGLATVAVNGWYRKNDLRFHLWGREINLKSDGGDAIRWLLTFVITDIPIIYLLKPSPIGMYGMWFLLIFSAFFDIFQSKYRLPVTAFGILCSVGTFINQYPQSPTLDVFWWIASIGCVLMFFYYVEQIWLSEAMRRLTAQEREQHTALQAERLHRKAILGENVRIIAHEVSNLTMAISLAVHNPEKINISAIQRSSDYLKKLTRLVLEDMKATPMIRRISVADLISDINVLLRKQVEMLEITWTVSVEPEIANLIFKERAGSTYFVMQNLIRNAIEAIQQRTPAVDGQIAVSVIKASAGLEIIVNDNGIGMSRWHIQELLNGNSTTTKIEGHGIGMRFVIQELKRNGFTLNIRSLQSAGTSFHIGIPLTDGKNIKGFKNESDFDDLSEEVQREILS